MLQIMCIIDPEDYANLNSMSENNLPVNYYGYKFEVEGGSESEGGNTKVKLMVVELQNANITAGFAIANEMNVGGEFKLGFISQDNPSQDIPVICKLSNEVKRASYMGDDTAKLEYIGFSLEQFYREKGATFYMYDLRNSKMA